MANTDQTSLSDFIKSVHKKLREEAKILGTEQAWKDHCENMENLEKYAEAMQKLAVDHWDRNSQKDCKVVSRVLWVYEASKEYFQHIEKYRSKEDKIAKDHINLAENRDKSKLLTPFGTRNDIQYELLDVGSCYNPFKQYNVFKVLPIDIAPANKEVQKCDFLNVKISDRVFIIDNVVTELPHCYFDIIAFSLLLEYLPTPELRLKCCLNAYKLLKTEGILVIITPDSNHVGSNAKIIKSWQYVLAKHGFIRIKYEKLPYLHCMVFRKALYKEVAQRWAKIHENSGLFIEINIPQDFQDTKDKDIKIKQKENKKSEIEWSNETFLNSFDCSSM